MYEDIVGYQNNQPQYAPVEYPIDYLCPLYMETYDVPEASQILYRSNNKFSSYLRSVKKFDFSLSNLGLTKLFIWLGLDPHNPNL